MGDEARLGVHGAINYRRPLHRGMFETAALLEKSRGRRLACERSLRPAAVPWTWLKLANCGFVSGASWVALEVRVLMVAR